MLFHPNSHQIIAGHLLFLGTLQFLQEIAIRGPLSSFSSRCPQAQPHPLQFPSKLNTPKAPGRAGSDPRGARAARTPREEESPSPESTELVPHGGNRTGKGWWEQSTAAWGGTTRCSRPPDPPPGTREEVRGCRRVTGSTFAPGFLLATG